MRTPAWLSERLGMVVSQVRARKLTFADGAASLAQEILADPDMAFAVAVMYAGRRMRRLARATVLTDHQLSLFPDLPGLGNVLETKVNVFKAIAAMTAADWEGALRQIETKERSATAQADRVRAYWRVRPLLTTPEMTTADVIGLVPAPA
jgi:hypothetical protein